jgi:hypothetical protein
MPTNAQISANRANAEHSTGPKTVIGKAVASRNAIRHGLTGKQVVINGEDPAAYEALRRDLIDSYGPVGAAEAILVEEIAQNFWRLQRARALEAEQFKLACGGADPIIGFNSSNADFDRLRRYMTSIERAYHRAIEQLQKTQSLRKKTVNQSGAESSIGFVSQSHIRTLTPHPDARREPGNVRPIGFVSQGKAQSEFSGISSLRQRLR